MLARSAMEPIRRSILQLAVAALCVAMAGCCGPYIRSQQSAYAPAGKGHVPHHAANCGQGQACIQGCEDGQLKLGLPFPILHAIAGPFIPREIADPYQSSAHPPHSKFHPVPTRAVFSPPEEMGPFSPIGSGYMLQPGPTLADPPAEILPPVDQRRPLEPPADNQRLGTETRTLVPGGAADRVPASSTPQALDAAGGGVAGRSLPLGEAPPRTELRAVSADARFVTP